MKWHGAVKFLDIEVTPAPPGSWEYEAWERRCKERLKERKRLAETRRGVGRKRTQTAIILLLCGLFLFVALSFARYRFAHPAMTETQLFLHFGDAMRWR
jgi:hypothetical protein